MIRLVKGSLATAASFIVLAGSASAALSDPEARNLAKVVLHRQFWGIGDLGYKGKVTIRDPGGQVFYYSFVIRRTNFFCASEGGSNCVEVIRRG